MVCVSRPAREAKEKGKSTSLSPIVVSTCNPPTLPTYTDAVIAGLIAKFVRVQYEREGTVGAIHVGEFFHTQVAVKSIEKFSAGHGATDE